MQPFCLCIAEERSKAQTVRSETTSTKVQELITKVPELMMTLLNLVNNNNLQINKELN